MIKNRMISLLLAILLILTAVFPAAAVDVQETLPTCGVCGSADGTHTAPCVTQETEATSGDSNTEPTVTQETEAATDGDSNTEPAETQETEAAPDSTDTKPENEAPECTCGNADSHAMDCPLYPGRVVTTSACGLTFSIAGDLPEGITATVEPVTDELSLIRESILGLGALAKGQSHAAYDITLIHNGTEYEPTSPVTVRISGGKAPSEVYHLTDISKADLLEYAQMYAEAAAAEVNSIALYGGEQSFAQAFTQPFHTGKGYFEFETYSFSVFYIVIGNKDSDTILDTPIDNPATAVTLAPGGVLTIKGVRALKNEDTPVLTVDPETTDITCTSVPAGTAQIGTRTRKIHTVTITVGSDAANGEYSITGMYKNRSDGVALEYNITVTVDAETGAAEQTIELLGPDAPKAIPDQFVLLPGTSVTLHGVRNNVKPNTSYYLTEEEVIYKKNYTFDTKNATQIDLADHDIQVTVEPDPSGAFVFDGVEYTPNKLTIHVGANAVKGTYRFQYNGYVTQNGAITSDAATGKEVIFTVTDNLGILNGYLSTYSGTNIDVNLTCVWDSSDIPPEPMIGDGWKRSYFEKLGDSKDKVGEFGTFQVGAQGASYVSVKEDVEKLIKMDEFAQLATRSVDGNNVLGVAGMNQTTKDLVNFTDAQWHDMLKTLVAKADAGPIKLISDGKVVTLQDSDPNAEGYVDAKDSNGNYRYVIMPYVVKIGIATSGGAGWHVDCAVVDTLQYTVTYNANLPEGSYVNDPSGKKLSLYPTHSYTPGTDVPISQMHWGTSNKFSENTEFVLNESVVTVRNSSGVDEKFLFTGWNTQPDGSGTSYLPPVGSVGGDTIRDLQQDVTLYAQWKQVYDVKLTKNVVLDASDPRYTELTTNAEYQFEITLGTAGASYPYTIYTSDGTPESSGTLQSGSKFTLNHQDYIVIQNIDSPETISFRESLLEPYDSNDFKTTWLFDGKPYESGKVTRNPTFTIPSPKSTEIVCTNEFLPAGNLRITKSVKKDENDFRDLSNESYPFYLTAITGHNSGYDVVLTYDKYCADQTVVSGRVVIPKDRVSTLSSTPVRLFELKDGESAEIKNLRNGMTLTIQEPVSTLYTPEWTVDQAEPQTTTSVTASIAANETRQILCTNAYIYGEVNVEKQANVNGDTALIPEGLFTFFVQEFLMDGARPNVPVCLEYVVESKNPNGDWVQDSQEQLKIDPTTDLTKKRIFLENNQRARFLNLPVGLSLKFNESKSDYYSTTWTLGEGAPSNEVPQITIKDSQPQNLLCTNTFMTGSLTIQKTGLADSEQSCIFNVTGSYYGVQVQVVVTGNQSVTINNLPYDTYTVTEVDAWTWKYTCGSGSATLNPENPAPVVTITNQQKPPQWLTDEAVKENNFKQK